MKNEAIVVVIFGYPIVDPLKEFFKFTTVSGTNQESIYSILKSHRFDLYEIKERA